MQRYWCKKCTKTFGVKKNQFISRYSQGFKDEIIKRYIEDLSPYRTISKRLSYVSLSPPTIWRIVIEAGRQCKNTLTVAKELKPSWSGILGIDGKVIKIFGKEYTLLLAFDIGTQDIVHFVLAKSEDIPSAQKLIFGLKEIIKYPFRGIVSDLRKGTVSVIKEELPDIPFQPCIIHLGRYIDHQIPKGKKSKYHKLNRELRILFHEILFSKTEKKMNEAFDKLYEHEKKFTAKYHKSVIKTFKRYEGPLSTHFKYPDIPRDNNIAENIIKQLNRRINLFAGFQRTVTAYAVVKLLVMWYRFKSFTDSRDKAKNGKSPLHLSGIKTEGIDWVKYSRKKSN